MVVSSSGYVQYDVNIVLLGMHINEIMILSSLPSRFGLGMGLRLDRVKVAGDRIGEIVLGEGINIWVVLMHYDEIYYMYCTSN